MYNNQSSLHFDTVTYMCKFTRRYPSFSSVQVTPASKPRRRVECEERADCVDAQEECNSKSKNKHTTVNENTHLQRSIYFHTHTHTVIPPRSVFGVTLDVDCKQKKVRKRMNTGYKYAGQEAILKLQTCSEVEEYKTK